MLAALTGFATKFAPQILSGLSSAAGHAMASSRQENAQEFSAGQFATRYQTTVKDMEAAGLNPALAYQQGGGSPPSSSAASASNFDMSSAQSALISSQTDNVKADTQNKRSQTANIEADTALKRAQMYLATAQENQSGASADQARAQINYLEQMARSVSESVANIPKEGARLDALVKNLAEEFKVIQHKAQTQEQATHQMRWLARKTMLSGDLVDLDVKAAQAFDNLGREYKQIQPIVDLIRSFIRR